MLSNEQLWKKEWTLLSPVLQEVATFMEVKSKAQNQEFDYELRIPSGQAMYMSRVGLKLIVSNLLSNAIKYNEEGKTVEFRVHVDKGTLHVLIADHGSGMTASQLEHLFIKYNKLNHEKGGQGIGLDMVK